MKKIFTILAAVMVATTTLHAELVEEAYEPAPAAATQEENISFAYEAGAEVVSAYLWRGIYNGGLSFQPTASVGFDALDENIQFRFGAWGSVGASDWKFQKGLPLYPDDSNPNTYFVPELDIFGSVQLWGVTLGFTHYYYFGGTPYFAKLEDAGGSQTEIQIGYNTGDLIPGNLYFNWYTMIAGNDVWYDANDVAHRAWSSYIELGYDYTWEDYGLTLGGQIGMSPWKSDVYSNEKFAVVNLGVKLNKEWEFDVVTLDLFAQGTFNPDGLITDKNDPDYNVFRNKAGDDKLYLQKLNGTIGLGIWF